MQWKLDNINILSKNKLEKKASVTIKGDLFHSINNRTTKNEQTLFTFDGEGLLCCPGLINGHDHLMGTYLPRIGDRKPYMNWLEWDNDLKNSPIYAERQLIPSPLLYTLGGFRHLICGVTHVQDHIPHFVRNLFAKNMPIKLIDKYTLAHSVSSYALPWGDGIEAEHENAIKNNLPFITHCSEGYDQETLDAVQTLEKHNALSEHTILIHGIAFSDLDIKKLKANNVSTVLCPTSNLYMFNKTAPISKLIDANINLCLGTDSPMSGSINLFEEIALIQEYYKTTYNKPFPEHLIFEMLTVNAAQAFRLEKSGSIEEQKNADFILLKNNNKNPYEVINTLQYDDIMLVVIDGLPRYGDPAFYPLFIELEVPFQKIKVAGINRIIYGDTIGLMKEIQEYVGFKKEFIFFPIEPSN